MEAALPAFFCPRPLPSCFVRPLAAARPPRRYSENTMNSRLLSGDSGAEAGQIIATTISGRNGLPKQPVSYIAERVVGTGSFGVVFQAKCLETGEAGEFFYSARRSVLAQQRQLEANQFGFASILSFPHGPSPFRSRPHHINAPGPLKQMLSRSCQRQSMPKAMLIPVLSEMGLLDAKYEHCRLWRAAEGRRGGRRHHRHQAGPHRRAARRHQVTGTTPHAQVVQHFLLLLVCHI